MLTVLHGDNETASRTQMLTMISQAKKAGVSEVIRLNGKSITMIDLKQSLESRSFFGDEKIVVIENLLSRPKSNLKNDLIQFLKTVGNLSSTPELILWEQKIITSAQLKALGNPKHLVYKIASHIFEFLDALTPGRASLDKLDLVLDQEASELVFALIVRQIRLLIMEKTHTNQLLPSWQKQKLQLQSNFFTLNQLLLVHTQLLEMDYHQKNGQSLLSLEHELDRLLLTI